MKKIIIIGITASGKTTLANKLSKILNIPVYHLDKLFWVEKGGIKQDVFIAQQQDIISTDTWIMDGSFPRSKSLDMRISSADTIVFYDLPLLLILWRQTKRFFKYYNKVRPDMGGNNKQKYPFTWKEIKYALNYPTQEIYSKILPYQESKTLVIIKNPRDETTFLKKVESIKTP